MRGIFVLIYLKGFGEPGIGNKQFSNNFTLYYYLNYEHRKINPKQDGRRGAESRLVGKKTTLSPQ